jgi:holliday junction DNA helicase RuvA
MIASLRGRLTASDADGLVIEVGGVGLRVHATRAAAAAAGGSPHDIALFTHLVVREDALSLYGFASADERALFLALMGVGGVGPKLALAVLSTLSPQQVRRAIAADDVALLATAPGVGRRLAQRMVVDLRDSLGAPPAPAVAVAAGTVSAGDAFYEARDALVLLGYSVSEAEGGLAGSAGAAEERVRHALAALGARA